MTKPVAYRRLNRLLWAGFLVALLAVAGGFAVLSYGDLPTLTQLENPTSELASEVYAADGSTLGRYYVENRVAVRYPDLNPYLVDALLSTEDERYYKHSGIDWWGLARAVGRLGKDGGASTITQQLAKLTFTGRRARGFVPAVQQKLKEWIIATRLERNYTKEEILAMYLNEFEFNYGAFGIEAASEIYFGKPQAELDRPEAAMLVGMLKSPSLYSPNRNPELARKRREVVLKQMVRAGRLHEAAYDSLRLKPLEVVMAKQTHIDGPAPYFRMELRKQIRRILSDPTIRNADGEEYDVNRDGLKIYTTIDPGIQALAEQAAWEHMAQLQETFRDEWDERGLDPWTFRDKVGTDEETTPEELAYRKRRLAQFVRESDRYEHLRARMMADVTADVATAYEDWDMTGLDVERMIDEEATGKRIANLKRSNSIGETLEGRYRGLLADEKLWPAVKASYLEFQGALREEFDTPTEMTVFAYVDGAEKDTVMTPLDSIKYHRSFLQIGSMAVDPHSGHVKAWVGGVNHKWFPFDHVQSRRQVGSTFKPFVYATAVAQQGIAPCYRVADLPQTIRKGEGGFALLDDWAPGNANGEFTGEYLTLMDALRKSKNSVSVFLMKQLSNTEPVRGLVHNMGIDSSARYSTGRHVVPPSPSIALGATDLSVAEMAGAYTTWSNDGVYVKPVVVQRIEDQHGKVLYRAIPEERTALDPVSNYTMVRMLQYAGANNRYFGGVETAYGGKTGTTNDYVDGWYMGVTPNLVVGTWVGGDERYIRFRTLRNGQGGRMARPYFAKFITAVEADAEALGFEKGAQFTVPSGARDIDFECEDAPEGFGAFPGALAASDSTDLDEDGGAFGGGGFGGDPFGDPGFGDADFGEDPFGDEVPVRVDTTAF